jgi:rhomboid family GlyGly-CTERM serine protease
LPGSIQAHAPFVARTYWRAANLRGHLAWLAVAGLAILPQLAGGLEAWRLERYLAVTEPWRLLTAHLAHVSWLHLALNLAGGALIWTLVGTALTVRQWALLFLFCAFGVDLGLLVFSPSIEWYAGLSGVLHGLLAAGALAGLHRNPVLGILLLTGLALKLLVEQAGPALAPGIAPIGAPVVVGAHLYGALSGIVGVLALRLCRNLT